MNKYFKILFILTIIFSSLLYFDELVNAEEITPTYTDIDSIDSYSLLTAHESILTIPINNKSAFSSQLSQCLKSNNLTCRKNTSYPFYLFLSTPVGNTQPGCFLISFNTTNIASSSEFKLFVDNNSTYKLISPQLLVDSSNRLCVIEKKSDGTYSVLTGNCAGLYSLSDWSSYYIPQGPYDSEYTAYYNSSYQLFYYGGTTLEDYSSQPEIDFSGSEFDESLGKLNIKSTRYLDTAKHIYHDFFTIDTTTTTDVDITQSGYGIKCQVLFYGKDNYSYSTDYFDLSDYRFNFDWKNKNFSGLSLPSQPDFDKVTQYRLYLFPFKEENGLIKRGLHSSVSYGDYTSNGSYLNTRYSSGHRVGAHRPQGSDKELDTFITPLPVSHGSGFFLSDNDTLINKYIYEYHYPGEPDETVIYDITNNITNPDSIVDVPAGDSISDFDFGTIKAFLTGLYNFLFKLSKVLILWLGLPPALATILNLGLYVIVFLIFGTLFKKLF